MSRYSLSHLADAALLHATHELVARDRSTTAAMLAHLAEVDARKLYLPAAYPSMYAWCVGELKLSEDAAAKRIQAGRLARRFPAIFPLLADGRLHLSAVVLLAPHLTPDNAHDLLAAAVHKTKPELELLLAQRFPRPDVPTLVQALAPAGGGGGLLASVRDDAGRLASTPVCESREQHAPGHVVTNLHKVGGQGADAPRPRVAPLSPGRFALQLTVAQETHDKLRYAQALLGHAVPSGDVAEVLDRALDALIRQLEQRRFAPTARPRRQRGGAEGRHIPATIRRVVWQRDGGRCTFTSETGQRCEATSRLELDHIEPVARGGPSTPGNLRLRCRAHNQHMAERVYGQEFMRHKRDESRRRAAEAREAAQAHACEAAQTRERERERVAAAARQARVDEVIPWLRALGFSVQEARRAAALGADLPDAPLEQRVRVALKSLAPNHARRVMPVASAPA